jgi:hypothetical protein
VLVEPYSLPMPGYVFYAYRKKLLRPASWRRLLAGRSELGSGLLARLRRPPAAPPPPPPAPEAPTPTPTAGEAFDLLPPRDTFVGDVRGLLERDVRLCFVYSVESPAYFNYLTALRPRVRPFLRSGEARLVTFDRTDHVFSPHAVQDGVVAAVRAWAEGFSARS